MIGEANSDRLYCRLVADAEMQDLNEFYSVKLHCQLVADVGMHELCECSTVLNYNTNRWQILLHCEICVIKLQFIR